MDRVSASLTLAHEGVVLEKEGAVAAAPEEVCGVQEPS